MSLLVTWIALTISLFASAKLLKGMNIDGGVGAHFGVAALYGVLLFAFGWCIHGFIGVASLGLLFLFSFVGRLIAGTILLIVTDKISKKLSIEGIGTAFAAAFITALVSGVAEWAIEQI